MRQNAQKNLLRDAAIWKMKLEGVVMQVTFGVLPFCSGTWKLLVINMSWLNQNLSFLFVPNYKKKTYQWFLFKRFFFFRKGRNKLTKQRTLPFGICVWEENMTSQNCKVFSCLHYLFVLIKFTGCLNWLHTFLRINIWLGILHKVSKMDFIHTIIHFTIFNPSFWSLEHLWLKIMWLQSSHNPECS